MKKVLSVFAAAVLMLFTTVPVLAARPAVYVKADTAASLPHISYVEDDVDIGSFDKAEDTAGEETTEEKTENTEDTENEENSSVSESEGREGESSAENESDEAENAESEESEIESEENASKSVVGSKENAEGEFGSSGYVTVDTPTPLYLSKGGYYTASSAASDYYKATGNSGLEDDIRNSGVDYFTTAQMLLLWTAFQSGGIASVNQKLKGIKQTNQNPDDSDDLSVNIDWPAVGKDFLILCIIVLLIAAVLAFLKIKCRD